MSQVRNRPRRAAARKVVVQPLSAEHRRQFEDIDWAQHDPDVLDKYEGQFIVPFEKRVVAHGHDVATVLEEAARATGRDTQELPVVGINSLLQDVSSF
jgi:hypothetical protein